jgi:hypothetical protein
MTDDKKENNKLKDFVLRDIYYNEKTGFQNQARTYKAAKARLSDITPEYVKEWLGKQTGQQLKPYRGFNSYIVDGPNQEVAADLADFSRNSIYNRDYSYIFIALDSFTWFAWAVRKFIITKRFFFKWFFIPTSNWLIFTKRAITWFTWAIRKLIITKRFLFGK